MQRLVKEIIVLAIIYFLTLFLIPTGITQKMIEGFILFYTILFGAVSRETNILSIYIPKILSKLLFFRKITYRVSIWAVIWAIWVHITTILISCIYFLNNIYEFINFVKLHNLYSSITLLLLTLVCFLIAIPEAILDINKRKRKW